MIFANYYHIMVSSTLWFPKYIKIEYFLSRIKLNYIIYYFANEFVNSTLPSS